MKKELRFWEIWFNNRWKREKWEKNGGKMGGKVRVEC